MPHRLDGKARALRRDRCDQNQVDALVLKQSCLVRHLRNIREALAESLADRARVILGPPTGRAATNRLHAGKLTEDVTMIDADDADAREIVGVQGWAPCPLPQCRQ